MATVTELVNTAGTKIVEKFYAWGDETKCVHCCLIPDELCWRIEDVCGHVVTGRMRRTGAGSPGVYPYEWTPCSSSDGSTTVYLQCDSETGKVQALVSLPGAGGGTTTWQYPTFCPFNVYFDEDVGTARCGPSDNRIIHGLRISTVGELGCALCSDGEVKGSLTRGITKVTTACCPVCPCCALMSGRDSLKITLDAFGCDWDGIEVYLDAEPGECTWRGTWSSSSTSGQCPDIIVTARCIANGNWEVNVRTDSLDCGGEGTEGGVTFQISSCPEPGEEAHFTDPQTCTAA